MKNRLKTLILFTLIMGVVMIMPSFICNTDYTKAADEDKPFTVLEIVPYEGMGKAGYLVGGQEPIEKERMSIDTAYDELEFLGGAISVFPSYEESAIPETGLEAGWKLAYTYVPQDGYYLKATNGDFVISNNSNTYYERVADGTGTHKAVLKVDTVITNTYREVNEPVNLKNLKAYFVPITAGKTDVFSEELYMAYSVTECENNTGDYDYDYDTGGFVLNKGHGDYKVLFVSAYETDTDAGDGTSNGGSSGNTKNEGKDKNGDGNGSNGKNGFSNDRNGNLPGNGSPFNKNKKNNNQSNESNTGELIKNTIYYYMTVDYEIVDDNTGDYSVEPEDIEYVTVNNNGNYIESTGLIFDQIDDSNSSNNGNNGNSGNNKNKNKNNGNSNNTTTYKWVPADMPEDMENYHIDGDKIWVRKELVLTDYQYKYNVELINNEWFKRLTLKIPNSEVRDYPVTVKTIIPEDLQVEENQHLIPSADFFYINGDYNQEPGFIRLYEYYSTEGVELPANKKYADGQNSITDNLNFAKHDLNWNNVIDIFMRAAGIGAHKATVIMDPIAYDESLVDVDTNKSNPYDFLKKKVAVNSTYSIKTGTMCNVSKLYLMLDRENLQEFYNQFMNPATTVNIITKVDTNVNTTKATGSYVRPDSSDSSATSDAAIYWNEDTFQLKDKSLKVLNIESTADFTESENTIRTLLSGYSVEVVNMTSVQFNGNITDLNSEYDMIYIGSGNGRFNRNGEFSKFNFELYNRKSYVRYGDLVIMKDYNFKFLPTQAVEFKYYPGNDISNQRYQDLTEYLDAGFPIVLDDDIYNLVFNLRNSNEERNYDDPTEWFMDMLQNVYFDPDVSILTELFDFIIENKFDCNTVNFLNEGDSRVAQRKQEFFKQLNNAINIRRPDIKLVSPLSNSTEMNYTEVDAGISLLDVKIEVPLKNLLPGDVKYNGYLYIDKNGNGVFETSEMVDEIIYSETLGGGLQQSIYPYSFTFDMTNLNGVYQWKTVIQNLENSKIRTERTGYAKISNKNSIYILQVVDSSSSYSLATKINDESSLFKKYAKNLDDYNLVIETKTIDELAEFVKGYKKEVPESNKLMRYHLLIMDTPNTNISNSKYEIVRKNIKDEIQRGISVIFTKNSLNYNNQTNYFDRKDWSFDRNNTYNRINRDLHLGYRLNLDYYIFDITLFTNKYYNFSNLNKNGPLDNDNTYLTSYLTKTNDGSITRYPYEIGDLVGIAPNSFSDYLTEHFDLDNKKLVGWYCFADQKSPEVRAIGQGKDVVYEGLYSSSPNDVSSNYYLFSNGLSFYSGIKLANSDVSGNDNEMKLFVNTIIAAYKALNNRIVAMPPTIKVTKPVPIIDEENKNKIMLTKDDFTEDNLVVQFEIKDSSSQMDINISWDGNNTTEGNWNETIYKVLGNGELGTAISISGTNKNVNNGKYAVIIPKDQLVGEDHNLEITATNNEKLSGVYKVTFEYTCPPVVTIVEPVPITGIDNIQYIYVDADFTAIDSGEGTLENSEKFGITFMVDEAETEVYIDLYTKNEASEDISLVDVPVYSIDGENQTLVEPGHTTEKGMFRMDVPLSLMKKKNNFEIKIKATDMNGLSGETTVVLLRRSLFPLD